ncbi:bifunctional DNA primase/polymerase [Haloarcula sp. JP-L23]|uniref:bifunctional DNA primase/polymerase n=1 Tax=Haloarcula sp. JP-L23 TaxID=2716717 RepID=UPI00140EBD71|nr:hypothetical protein G9465_03105 [Haloarcula sp. JP-L23]
MSSGKSEVTSGSYVNPRTVVTRRLAEAGISANPFVRIDKIKEVFDHDSRFERPPDGNYGVYSVEDLAFVDVDDKEAFRALPVSLPPTFTTSSPHGGEHRYYIIDREIEGKVRDWGELRVNNMYVVGPGSELTECQKNQHDCSKPGEGHYRIQQDQPITVLDNDTLFSFLEAIDGDEENSTVGATAGGDTSGAATDSIASTHTNAQDIKPNSSTSDNGYSTTSTDLTVDERQRLNKAFSSKNGERLRALWEGRYSETEFDDDRSRAEQSLVSSLGWWFQNEMDTVARLMNFACERYPETDTGEIRKWRERDDIYRTLTLEKGCDHETTFNPPTPPLPYAERPAVSYVTRSNVQEAVLELEPATTQEIADHSNVDRSKRQVSRALNQLEEDDSVVAKQDPADRRRWLYAITPHCLSE